MELFIYSISFLIIGALISWFSFLAGYKVGHRESDDMICGHFNAENKDNYLFRFFRK